MHATAFIKSPPDQPLGAVVVLSGSERSLKLDTLAALLPRVCGADEESSVTKFNGKEVDWKSVRDELMTVSMFGDRRVVIVENADESGRSRAAERKKSSDSDSEEPDRAADSAATPVERNFLSSYRAALEKYVEKPSKASLLVLEVNSFPKTTRLYKLVEKHGLIIECTELQGADLTRWIQATAKERFSKPITREAAQLIPELVGTHLGLLEQEIEKLAAYVGERPQIDTEDVRKVVGGWKADTTWKMLDAVRDGNLGFALANLDKLLAAGEPTLKLMGAIVFTFRKLAIATELSRQGIPLSAALRQAGVFPNQVAMSEAYLRRIGRPRAEQILRWLLETELNLKGGSRTSERLLLERLFLKLSGKLAG